MKILALFLLLISFSAWSDISYVSDLDDTIKITEASGDPTDLLGSKVYTGMPEFIRSIPSKKLTILSASPSFIQGRTEKVLQKYHIRYKDLILRKNLFESKFDFKVGKLKVILDQNHDDFVFFGDDMGDDPEIYAEIKRLYPERILAFYIHSVKGRELPRGSIPYWTSLDLALREFLAGRTNHEIVEKEFKIILGASDLEYVFPKKAQCPTSGTIWNWQAETVYQPEAFELGMRLVSFCQQRQSDNILP